MTSEAAERANAQRPLTTHLSKQGGASVNATHDVIDRLLDVLTGAEITLITTTLDHRCRELTRRRDESVEYAAKVDEPDRQQLYREWADDDTREIHSLTALLAKLRND